MITSDILILYALPHHVYRWRIPWQQGLTAMNALHRCGAIQELSLTAPKLACVGRLLSDQSLIEAEDRIEILRPLQLDPKISRKERVQRARQKRLDNATNTCQITSFQAF